MGQSNLGQKFEALSPNLDYRLRCVLARIAEGLSCPTDLRCTKGAADHRSGPPGRRKSKRTNRLQARGRMRSGATFAAGFLGRNLLGFTNRSAWGNGRRLMKICRPRKGGYFRLNRMNRLLLKMFHQVIWKMSSTKQWRVEGSWKLRDFKKAQDTGCAIFFENFWPLGELSI